MRIIFPIVMMAAIIGANVYVVLRLWQILPNVLFLRIVAVVLYVGCMVGMFSAFGGTLDKLPLGAASVCYELFNTWLIFFLYILLAFILVDILRAVHVFPDSLAKDSLWGSLMVVGGVAVLLLAGNIHYRHKVRETVEMVSPKVEKPLRILLASDLHLGYHNRKDELSRWVDIINSEKPDLVLIGGDIIDMSARPLVEGNYSEEMRRIEAPVYAVLGNHEYYSGDKFAEEFFASSGIHLLRDEVASLMGIEVIGRDDRTNRNRLPLDSLMKKADPSLFTIVLDHQPSDLSEAEKAGVDFQFSGHTHRGQVWPISWITDMIFEDSWGPYSKGNTRYYVSSGLGIWGAKIRIGTRSEYLVVELKGE
ncbi:MAG: metallophosphoesterase [Bacteroidales bacterium]|nr:metallophosphoesterase [Bacteroidales bacterium]MBR1435606.1 metallophosphoesterase [Bacteroidales bacterium]